jgi:hypothetical protein
MTNEQIFELMKKHFRLCPIHDSAYIEWVGEERDFLRFARAIEELAQDLTNPPVEVLEFNGICRDNCQGTKISSLPGLPE